MILNPQDIDNLFNYWPLMSGKIEENDLSFVKECNKIGVKRTFRKGEIITAIGEYVSCIYLLNKGMTITTVIGQNGFEKVISICNPPWIFNDAPLLLNLDTRLEVRALTDCEIVIITLNKWLDVLYSNKYYLEVYLKYTARRRYAISNQLVDVWDLNPTQIIFKMLVCMAKESGIENNDLITIKITQRELANLCGLHRVTVARAFKRLKEIDVIKETNKSTVIICADLSAISFSDL